ncbi:MAG: CAP domain-containing protein [Hyphomicrobiaceae bacterium]|nr:CAP domain-containing protein [Hyphomicrobiaceae bacterium]
MYRVVLFVFFAMMLPGCSIGSKPLSLGFTDSGSSSGSAGRMSFGALGDGDSAPRSASSASAGKRTASLPDGAPRNSFEKASPGALSGRDYSATRLDTEEARSLINAYRKQNGLKPLRLSMELTNAAKTHSRDLARWDRISHYGSDGSNPWDRVKRSGYSARLAAENVGTGQASIGEVIKGWKASPGHNKNLLMADVEHMGIALVQDPRTEFKTFWTLVLGSPQ